MGVLFVEAPLRRLHRVVAFTARFLHHHRLDKLHIFGDSVLLRILLYQWRVSFDLRTDRGIGCAVAAAPEQGNGAPKQDDDEDYHDGNPAACDKGRNQRLSPCDNRLNCRNGRLDRGFRCFGCRLCGGFRRLCRFLGGFGGRFRRFLRRLCGLLRGLNRCL